MTPARELEHELEPQGTLIPPPSAPKLTDVSDPEKPPCFMCGHTWRDHAVLRCTGHTPSLALDREGRCSCVRYVAPPQQGPRRG